MRPLSTATLAAAVALAFSTAAQSQQISTFQGTPTLRGQVAAAPVANTGNTSSTVSSNMTRSPSVTVDVRAQQTAAATSLTHASGSTAALAGLLSPTSATGGTAGTGTTSGAGTGTTGGTGTIGGFGTIGTNGSGTVNGLVPFGAPAIVSNPSDVTTGFPATTATGVNGNGAVDSLTDVVGGAAVVDTTLVAQADRARVDRAIRQVSNDRRRIGRNGQLLQTIAPRTNVDRSKEMPDDPLPPSLTGSNSALVR